MKLSEFLQKANSESDGTPSHMRTTTFYTILQWSPAVSFGFIWVVVMHPEMTIPYLSILIAGLLGLLGMKNWQNYKEKDAGQKQ